MTALVGELKLGPALACAYSNVGVDQLLTGFAKAGLKVVRLGDPERVNNNLTQYTMGEMERKHPRASELERVTRQLDAVRSSSGGLGNRQMKELYKTIKKLRTVIFSDIIDNCDVVCATCVGAGGFLLNDRQFALVLVDECTQATEPACLVPITKCSERVVLVGDHMQLPPTITSDKLKRSGLAVSLFERLLDVFNPTHPDNVTGDK